MYILLRKLSLPGYKTPYFTILESEDLTEITDKLKRQVTAGCPVNDLKIVEDKKFEFKCAVKFDSDVQ